MNDSDDELRFKSKNQKKKQAINKKKLYSKEQSDSVSNEERGEIVFIIET